MFGTPSKSLKIVSTDPDTEAQRIREVLDEMSHSWSWVTFECTGSSCVIEIAHGKDHLTLNITHEETNGLTPRLNESSLAIPKSWTIAKNQAKRLLRAGFLEIRVGLDQRIAVSLLLRQMGTQLLGWMPESALIGTFQK